MINKKIPALESSGLNTGCEGSWRFLLLLVIKPHQEDCTDIGSLIGILCVNYRQLNSINLRFEFPIPRFADIIEDLSDLFGPFSMISLNPHSAYH